MRKVLVLLFVSLGLAACGGGDRRPVIVNQQPGTTVVVPPSGTPVVCPYGAATC